MSSHREAPANKSLTAFSGIPNLADWHTNLHITDLYVFRKPGDEHKSILIMNVNPMPPKLADAFDPTALYEFRIDTNGDAVAATVRRATGTRAASDSDSGEIIIANAPVSFDERGKVTEAGTYTFFAGIRSDPLFFDLMGFCNNSRFTGNDYFTDKEVFGIVLEIPNTEPDKQKAPFLDSFVALLESLGHSASKAQEIALTFLPDILPYDVSNEQGFFNGRKLTDDVVDIVLNLVTGGKVTTDMVGPHTDYLTAFPYLGQPHGR